MSLCMCCQRDSGCCRKGEWVKRIEADGAKDERAADATMPGPQSRQVAPPAMPAAPSGVAPMTAVEKALRRLVKAQHRLVHALLVGDVESRVHSASRQVDRAEEDLATMEELRRPCSAGPKAHIE